jgi:hypothetical protein
MPNCLGEFKTHAECESKASIYKKASESLKNNGYNYKRMLQRLPSDQANLKTKIERA